MRARAASLLISLLVHALDLDQVPADASRLKSCSELALDLGHVLRHAPELPQICSSCILLTARHTLMSNIILNVG